MSEITNVMAIGIDSATIAASAKRAGYRVYAVDYFGDQDLEKNCEFYLSIINKKLRRSGGRIIEDYDPKILLELAKKLVARSEIDGIILASGLDDSHDTLSELERLVPIIGNQSRIIQNVRDKAHFFRELKRLSIHHPETEIVRDFSRARFIAKEVGYPVIVKPLSTLGGAGIRKVKNDAELKTVLKKSFFEEFLIQEFISGIDASISFLASNNDTRILTLTEQLIGVQGFGQKEPFGYNGNIVPLFVNDSLLKTCLNITKKIASHFHLIGSNGIDLVISDKGRPFVIEVNPRFQGTLECIESIFGKNLIDAHFKACERKVLQSWAHRYAMYCGRLILYARKRLIFPKLHNSNWIRNVPFPGTLIEEGEPLCSIICKGKTRDATFKKLNVLAEKVYNTLNIPSIKEM